MNRFLAADHRPTETEVVVQYSVLPLQKDSFHECLHQLVEGLLFSKSREDKYPLVFDLNQESSSCKIAFPEEWFEPGNLPQNLSAIAGSILQSPWTASVKVQSIQWTKKLERSFPGPTKGLKKIREALEIMERPLSSGLLLPKAALTNKQYLEKSYLMWMGGCDIVAENEIMASQTSSDFAERISFLSKEALSCSSRTRKNKTYIPNITSGTVEEMSRRLRICKEAGLQIVSVNLPSIGFAALNTLVQLCATLHLGLQGNQYAQGTISFGLGLPALATLYRMMGVDLLTVDASSAEITAEIKNLTDYHESFAATIPVCTGHVHAGNIEKIIKQHGHDLMLQGSRSIDEHPDGTKAGAEAFQYAIQSATQGIEIESALKKNDPFRRALEQYHPLAKA